MRLEWDKKKNQLNRQKHGFDFSDAYCVFEGETISFLDDRFDYQEARFITLGKFEERVVVIVHTPRVEVSRVISMRKANEREKKIYQKRLEKN